MIEYRVIFPRVKSTISKAEGTASTDIGDLKPALRTMAGHHHRGGRPHSSAQGVRTSRPRALGRLARVRSGRRRISSTSLAFVSALSQGSAAETKPQHQSRAGCRHDCCSPGRSRREQTNVTRTNVRNCTDVSFAERDRAVRRTSSPLPRPLSASSADKPL
jgi:hypothetical protein